MEYAVVFDNGVWVVMAKPAGMSAYFVEACPTFETAIHAIAIRTGGKVLIKTVTPDDY